MNVKNILIPVLAMLAAGTTAQARGILGENYVEVSAGFTRIDTSFATVDGWAYGLGGNYAVIKTNDSSPVGLDLNAQVGIQKLEYSGINSDATSAGIGALAYYDAGKIKPGLGVMLGYSWTEVDQFSFLDEDYLTGGVIALVECEVAPNFALTPFISFSRADDSAESSQWSFGTEISFWINEYLNIGVTGSYDRYDNDVDGESFSLSLRYGF